MKRNLIFLVLTGLVFWACSGPGDVAGGGTETETYGIVGGIVDGGMPSTDAMVHVRPITHLPGDDLEEPLDQVYHTDAEGNFAIDGLAAGTYGIIARSPAGKASYQVLELQADVTLEDTLEKTGTLQGTVIFPDSIPLSEIDVALLGLDLERLRVTDSLPDFAIDSIPAGTYTALSVPAGFGLTLKTLEQLGIRVGVDSVTVLDTIDFRFLDSLVTN